AFKSFCCGHAVNSPDRGPIAIQERSQRAEGLPAGCRSVTLALEALAQHLAMPAHRLGLFASAAFRRLFIRAPPLHFAKRALALHFLLQYPKGRVDVVVTNENLHRGLSSRYCAARCAVRAGPGRCISLVAGRPPPMP